MRAISPERWPERTGPTRGAPGRGRKREGPRRTGPPPRRGEEERAQDVREVVCKGAEQDQVHGDLLPGPSGELSRDPVQDPEEEELDEDRDDEESRRRGHETIGPRRMLGATRLQRSGPPGSPRATRRRQRRPSRRSSSPGRRDSCRWREGPAPPAPR